MFIRSDRLFLRPGWAEDWQDLAAAIADRAVVRNLARAPWPYRGEHAREFLADTPDPVAPRFLVTLPGPGGAPIIGGAGLQRLENGAADAVELGYWIAPAHWGRGYAGEAVRAVLSVARALGHRRVVARHFVDNQASGRVLEKAGFQRTGHVYECFSAGRGLAYPVREYAIALDRPAGCGDDDDDGPMIRKRAA